MTSAAPAYLRRDECDGVPALRLSYPTNACKREMKEARSIERASEMSQAELNELSNA